MKDIADKRKIVNVEFTLLEIERKEILFHKHNDASVRKSRIVYR